MCHSDEKKTVCSNTISNKWYFNGKKNVTDEILENAHCIIYRRVCSQLAYIPNIYLTYPLSQWNEIFHSYTLWYNLCGWRTLAVHRKTFRHTIILYCTYSRVRVFRITKLQKYKTSWATFYTSPPSLVTACHTYTYIIQFINKYVYYTLRC